MDEHAAGETLSAANGLDHGAPSAADKIDKQTAIVTAGVIVVAAALVEVALVPGMIVGAVAALSPKYAPQIGKALRPALRSAVRGAYSFGRKAREAAAEAKEQVHDIVAEVHAEENQAPAPTHGHGAATPTA